MFPLLINRRWVFQDGRGIWGYDLLAVLIQMLSLGYKLKCADIRIKLAKFLKLRKFLNLGGVPILISNQENSSVRRYGNCYASRSRSCER